MSDSLRDQLLKAGFSKPKSDEPKAKHRPSASQRKRRQKSNTRSQLDTARSKSKVSAGDTSSADAQAIAERKAIKAKIKTLIETTAIKEFGGEIVYRFTLQNRIRELHINEAVFKQLVDDVLVITRLNGSTYLVPEPTAQQIKALNPQWAIVEPSNASSDESTDYEAYPIPDDLQW